MFYKIFNLSTGKYLQQLYCSKSITMEEAVISAYAQLINMDYNTWDYKTKYSSLVNETSNTIACGDFVINKHDPFLWQ